MGACMYMCVCTCVCPQESRRRCWILPELESQAVVSLPMEVLGNKNGLLSSARVVYTLNY